jgi:hypothetical protein
MSDKTQHQVAIEAGYDGILPKTEPTGWPAKVRLMRRDPTISLARKLLKAPILAAAWTIAQDEDSKDDPLIEEIVTEIDSTFQPMRKTFLSHAASGYIDYGWATFEKVFEIEDGDVDLCKLKPLLWELTEIRVDTRGNLWGVQNRSPVIGRDVNLNVSECIVLTNEPEAGDYYGEALLRAAEGPYDAWEAADESARRYDAKIAGAHWVVYYPPGDSVVGEETTPNFKVAQSILNGLESNGKIAIPSIVAKQIDDLNNLGKDQLAWRIEILSAQGGVAGDFDTRLRYYDALKARALGLPERSILEGQFGTKAEAEAHADFAINNIEEMHQSIVDQLNCQCVDQIIRLKFGEEYVGTVRIVPEPLTDSKRTNLKDLFTAFMTDDAAKAEIIDKVDILSVLEQLGVPLYSDEPTDGPAGILPHAAATTTNTDTAPTGILPSGPAAA